MWYPGAGETRSSRKCQFFRLSDSKAIPNVRNILALKREKWQHIDIERFAEGRVFTRIARELIKTVGVETCRAGVRWGFCKELGFNGGKIVLKWNWRRLMSYRAGGGGQKWILFFFFSLECGGGTACSLPLSLQYPTVCFFFSFFFMCQKHSFFFFKLFVFKF